MADILIVDDEADIRELISDLLEDEGHRARTATDADSAFAEIDRAAPDLVILDIWLQGSRMDGIEILKRVKRDNPDLPIVIISGHGNIEVAVAAVKQGAYDFIEKPFTQDQLLVVVGRGLETSRLRRENLALKRANEASAELIGASPAMNALRFKLDRVARTGSRVLLTGGPGTGKEVSARYIHRKSSRKDAPFIVVNAASMEADRMEEVLFGRESPDQPPQIGLFERAHGGTLFIDEVGDMPVGTQSKILRVLLDQAFTRLGGSNTVRVDVRLISATNRNLQSEIAAGRFREDLYHRLNVVPIELPTLEHRREDIPQLAQHFLEMFAREQGLPRRTLSEGAIAALQTRTWPGNVRQLRNMMEQLLILGAENSEIAAGEMPGSSAADTADAGLGDLMGLVANLPLREARELFEREYLIAQINRFGGNISKTASFVGMERSALHRKLKMLNVVTTSRGGVRMAVVDETGTLEDDDLAANDG
ncbi:sigma-54 dependent transcriptional regulator [Paralimibaculum aggregatum]|uniref:Sigma-54 dependent transcriptional regulator n=1 Tax=Paralimibaculum aggregatum TaxID=3036245 RepID=A0ABQ6LJW8_9RHOB|nr:sigma-54 dependent transcriptional regulator [Limibaculum sp. NKW23]GMG83553.1 sigma-54 dependent transcriptional regulator [Limibaculum sp. NKW23]